MLHTDIDWMSQYEDFLFDGTKFPTDQMKTFVDQLHANGQRYTVIIDPGIHNRAGYAPYDDGLTRNVFIRNADQSVFIGKVWPGTTAFPDWFHPVKHQSRS